MADRITWTSPDGVTVDLTDEAAGYTVSGAGTTGLRSVTYAFSTASYAGMDGETVHAIRAEANNLTLGLHLSAADETSFRAKARGLVHVMRPKAGLGVLAVRNDAGEVRALPCYCTGGLEGDEAPNVIFPGRWWKLVLKFFAPDPWWLGEEETLSVGLGAGANFFPIFPLTLAPSTVQGRFAVDLSDADAPAHPVWTITGPGSTLVLTNQTTGRTITANATLGAGQSMIIDTRPGFQSVRRDDGTNLLGALASDPALWPLVEGVNEVSAALTGATSASRIVGTFRPRYAGI